MIGKNGFAALIAFAGLIQAGLVPAAEGGTDTTVVSQGGVSVTLADVDAYMQRVPKEKWSGFIDNAQRIETVLKNLLRTKQLAQQAKDEKLDQTPEMRGQLALAQDEVLAKARLDEFTQKIKTPDLAQLAKEQYTAHKSDYVTPAKVTVQHLLIATGKHSDADAKALAETVRSEALKDPAQFGALVEKYSDDPSKISNHGRMEDATSSKYAPEFARTAGELTAQEPISQPVKTKFGYHVLKLVAREEGKPQTFDEVKAKLIAGLREQYVSDQRTDFLNQLSNQKLEPNPDIIASLHGRYSQGAEAAAAPAAAETAAKH